MKKITKACVFFIENLLIKVFSIAKVKKSYIMLDSWNGREFSGDIKVLYDYLVEHFSHANFILVTKQSRVVSCKIREVSRKSLKYYYFRACSYHYITNYYYVNQLRSVKTRRNTHYILVWHAAGIFKKIGKSTADSQGKRAINKAGKNISALIVSSKHVKEVYARDLGITKERVVTTGIFRSDFIVKNKLTKASILEKYGLEKLGLKTIILYAPTIRDDKSVDFLPDFKVMKETLGSKYSVVLQLHPMNGRYQVDEAVNDFVLQIQTATSEELMICADIMITDYSSLIFDFAYFQRPMVFYIPDGENYISSKGFYIDYFENTPGKKAINSQELIESILTAQKDFKRYQGVRDVLLEYSRMDGRACERFVEIFFKEQPWLK